MRPSAPSPLPRPQSSEHTRRADALPHAIRLRGLDAGYAGRRVLRSLDLVLDDRQIVAVVGPDGAGKTTLIRTLAGLLEVTADEATVLGHDLRSDVSSLKALVGYVPQTFGLHRDLTVLENLRFTARLHRLDAADFATRSAELLARTGLAPFGERRAGALSGGMKQKLAIANALLTRPALLLLDEPTSGVDVAARDEIRALLEREQHHNLIVFSTSYLDEAAASDLLIYLDRGRLVASGPPSALLRHAAELYRAWGEDPWAIADAARRLPYVDAARATAGFARVEVVTGCSPGAHRVVEDLEALDGCTVRFAEVIAPDLEAALVALVREASRSEAA